MRFKLEASKLIRNFRVMDRSGGVKRLVVFCLLLQLLPFISKNAVGQSATGLRGYPPMVFYTPDEYIERNQVWCMAQDSRGWIWAALNGGSIILFDGLRWMNVPQEKLGLTRWLLYDAALDRMYFGALGTFGYYQIEESGEITPVYLSNRLP